MVVGVLVVLVVAMVAVMVYVVMRWTERLRGWRHTGERGKHIDGKGQVKE